MKTKKNRRQKTKDWAEFITQLKNTPEDKLSPMGKYWLAHANDAQVELNMKYVLR